MALPTGPTAFSAGGERALEPQSPLCHRSTYLSMYLHIQELWVDLCSYLTQALGALLTSSPQPKGTTGWRPLEPNGASGLAVPASCLKDTKEKDCPSLQASHSSNRELELARPTDTA